MSKAVLSSGLGRTGRQVGRKEQTLVLGGKLTNNWQFVTLTLNMVNCVVPHNVGSCSRHSRHTLPHLSLCPQHDIICSSWSRPIALWPRPIASARCGHAPLPRPAVAIGTEPRYSVCLSQESHCPGM